MAQYLIYKENILKFVVNGDRDGYRGQDDTIYG